ncbi:hypothetical protein A1A1_01333 [Planococcus antarcticus DSM 14505]|uniref:Uncharacterized protein n=2 Tax=Planococcus TaxID=1372 RepID=A0AA87IQ98_9BACL|nr:hypothetical protein A1A1_01333 [Planococcus antarcticus DSM 14505]
MNSSKWNEEIMIDFSQVDTSIINRMALFIGILAGGCIFFPLVAGGMLKIIKMPFFIVRIELACAGLGWFYYWATQILSEFKIQIECF